MWIYKSIWSNKAKTIALLICFPLVLFLVTYIIIVLCSTWGSASENARNAIDIALTLSVIVTIIWTISLFVQKKIIFNYTWTKELQRKENPKIYNIVENLCISKGLKTPKIWIIQDSSMNAFATWRSDKDSRVVFTTWLIDRLEDREIEAVAWHELTHITNRDCRLMAVIVVYIWVLTTIWSLILRRWVYGSNSGKWKSRAILPIIWIICLVLWYIFYPLIRLAISRKREYLADAWSVLLTKDKNAMISALKKISTDSTVESIQRDTVAAMCIENPLGKLKKWFSNLLSTHPSIEDRIAALDSYISDE